MISNLQELEKRMGQYEDWTETTLLEIVQTEELLNLFTPELATHLFETRSNDRRFDILLPVKYGYQLKQVMKQISGYIEQASKEEISIEEFRNNIIRMKDEGVLFSKTLAYLTILMLASDIDISEEVEEIGTVLDELIEIVDTIDVANGIEVIRDILQVVIQVREQYFAQYSVDVLKSTDKLKEVFEKIDEQAANSLSDLLDEENLEEDEDLSED